jgi:addiction module HigA family antidote
MTSKRELAPAHPGGILPEEFLKPLGLSQTRMGRDLGVSPRRINEIIHGKRSVTADTALRLSRYFGTSAEFWLGSRPIMTWKWLRTAWRKGLPGR